MSYIELGSKVTTLLDSLNDEQIEKAADAESQRHSLVENLLQATTHDSIWPILVWANTDPNQPLEKAISASNTSFKLDVIMIIARIDNKNMTLCRYSFDSIGGNPQARVGILSDEKRDRQGEVFKRWKEKSYCHPSTTPMASDLWRKDYEDQNLDPWEIAKIDKYFQTFIGGMNTLYKNAVYLMPEIANQLQHAESQAEKIHNLQAAIEDLNQELG